MNYEVILSDFAKSQLDNILLYTIKEKEVHIDRIYHELEDYKNLPD